MKQFVNKYLVLILVIAGISVFGSRYLLAVNSRQKIEHERVQKIKTILNKHGQHLKKGLNIIMVFKPEDCLSCIREIDYLAGNCENVHRFHCVGIVGHPYPQLVEKYVQDKQWTFPILIDSTKTLDEDLKIQKTPYKFVLNGNGKLVFTEGATAAWKQEGGLKSLLEKKLAGR